MKKIGLLLALIVSFGLQAQKVTRFSSLDAFAQEFEKLISVPKEMDGVFKDSLVPNFLAAVDFEQEDLWLDYANQLLRKRLDDVQTWEPLLRSLIYVAENEEFDRFGALLEHFYGFSKKNPSTRIRTYQNQFYLNLVKHEFSEPGALVWKAPASLWSLNFVEGVPQKRKCMRNWGSGHFRRIRRILKPIALHFMPMNSMTSRYKVCWKSAFHR